MNLFQFIKDNRSLILKLRSTGILRHKTEIYYAIYTRYLFYLSIGHNRTGAVRLAARDYCTCEKTGWLAIKDMEKTL